MIYFSNFLEKRTENEQGAYPFFFFVQVRVYNYNTMERVYDFEAHSDYLRSIAVHPTLPYIITSSDDMTIKLWDWEKRWENVQVNQLCTSKKGRLKTLRDVTLMCPG